MKKAKFAVSKNGKGKDIYLSQTTRDMLERGADAAAKKSKKAEKKAAKKTEKE